MRAQQPGAAERRLAIQQLDSASSLLVNAGIHAVVKNPIKVGVWAVGLLICLFFQGIKVTPEQQGVYNEAIEKVREQSDYVAEAYSRMHDADYRYKNSQGWFWSCDSSCQVKKRSFLDAQASWQKEKLKEQQAMRIAKKGVGLFSEYGVLDCRWLFAQNFAGGKQFAKRQTQWDALFMGIQAMGRDETFVSYLLRLLSTMLFNFTLGVMGALLGFLWSLWGLIVEYQANLAIAVTFFVLASLAAFSFATLWLLGIYAAAAGTVYVGGKFLIHNMRLADENGGRPRGRVE